MIAQRLAIVAIVATWSVPTIVGAQHAKAESTAAHASAPAKESAREHGAEHAPSSAKKDAAAEPVPQKSPATEASKDAGKSVAKPTSEHAAAKSDGKDKDTGAHGVEEAKGPAHASAEKASSEKEAEPAAGGKKVASAASARGKTAPKNELEAALRRIDEQMASIRTSPSAAQSGKPRAANETRPARVSPPPAPSVTRISLSWRTTLVWEQELDGGTDAAQDAPHVGLVWPIEPLESTPIAPTSAR